MRAVHYWHCHASRRFAGPLFAATAMTASLALGQPTPGYPSGFPLVPPPITTPDTTPQMPSGATATTASTPSSTPATTTPPPPPSALPSVPPLPIPQLPPGTTGNLVALHPDDPLLKPFVDLTLPPPGQPQPLSETRLEEVLAIAATESPTMREQADTVAQFDASRFRSWMRHMPAITGSFNLGMFYQASQTTTSGQNPTVGGAYTVQLSHPLWVWGAYDATRDLAFVKESLAHNEALMAYAKLCLDLRRKYYSLIVRKSEVQLLSVQLESAIRRVEKEQVLFANGRSTPDQLNQLALARDNLAVKKATAETDYKYEFSEFQRLSGAHNFEDDDVPAQIYLPVVDQKEISSTFDEFKKTGFDQSPIAREAGLSESAIDQQLIISRAQRRPQFNFSAGITQTPLQNTTNNSLGFSTILFVGVAGSWNIFDRGETAAQIRTLLAQKRIAETRLKNTREEVQNDAANNIGQIYLSLHALNILKAQFGRAQDDYERVLRLVALGRADQTLVDATRDNLLDLHYQILSRQANVATNYYNLISDMYRDPALSNSPPFALPHGP